MNESIYDDPSAMFRRCEDCGKLVNEELVSPVVFENIEMEMCQECIALWRENGKVIEFV